MTGAWTKFASQKMWPIKAWQKSHYLVRKHVSLFYEKEVILIGVIQGALALWHEWATVLSLAEIAPYPQTAISKAQHLATPCAIIWCLLPKQTQVKLPKKLCTLMYGRSHYWVLEQLFPDKRCLLKAQELLVSEVGNTEKRRKKKKWRKARTPPFSCPPLSSA